MIMYHSKTDYRLISSELLKKEKTKTEINFKTEYESICKIDYIKQIGEEGIEFIDQDTIDKQRSVVSYMIKKIGSNLLSGQSIMNTSLPIYIFEERSLLQSFGYKFRFASQFLSAAADAANIERLKQVTLNSHRLPALFSVASILHAQCLNLSTQSLEKLIKQK